MATIGTVRRGKPPAYPDQAVYAELACLELGLEFEEMDGGTGLLFRVSGNGRRVYLGAGMTSLYPQNPSSAGDLATDKYFSNRILRAEGIATLGGDYFFLSERFRAKRPPGHERADALAYLDRLGGRCFAKPLRGSRGDLAQIVEGEGALARYMDAVAVSYDAIMLQPVFTGEEYRVLVMDDEVIYAARKEPAHLVADGTSSVAELVEGHAARLHSSGISMVVDPREVERLGGRRVPARGERITLPGRMNRSAGGGMVLAEPPDAAAVYGIARRATQAHGLRIAGVDLFCNANGAPGDTRVIEVNRNPAIRLLEDSGRQDLIVRIWRGTFEAAGLLDV